MLNRSFPKHQLCFKMHLGDRKKRYSFQELKNEDSMTLAGRHSRENFKRYLILYL